MEGIDAYSFQELNQASPMMMNNPKSKILETISSWLDLDDHSFSSTFPQELQDLQMLDDNFFQFATTLPATITTTTTSTTNFHDSDEPLPHLPRPDSPFILDLHEFDPSPPPPLNTETLMGLPELSIVPEPDECETFLINDPDFGLTNTMTPAGTVTSPDTMSIDTNHFLDTVITNSCAETEQQQQSMIIDNVSPEAPQNETTGDDDEEEETDEDPKSRGTLNCKNLVSERNRRKRLSQQLLALRALVPNITKMDKRSVLVDALSYLKSMQEETARIQKELKDQPPQLNHDQNYTDDDDEDGNRRIPRSLASCTVIKPKPQIIEIDTEKIEDKRFVVKITCKGANVGGDVLRVIESVGFEITYAALDQIKPQHILTTIFIRVKKQEKMTEEKLKDCIISTALRSGLTLVQASS